MSAAGRFLKVAAWFSPSANSFVVIKALELCLNERAGLCDPKIDIRLGVAH